MYVRTVIVLLVLLAARGATSHAGEVLLVNGDRLSGTLSVSEDALAVDTSYAGTVALPWDQIERVVPGEDLQGAEILECIAMKRDIPLGPAGEHDKPEPDDPKAAPPEEAVETGETEGSEEEPAAPPKWSGYFEGGASWRTGETDAVDANSALELTRHWTTRRLSLKANYTYGEVDSRINTRRASGSLRFEQDFHKKFYDYIQTRAAHDPSERLDLRIGASAGLGWRIIDGEELSLKADLGLGYTRERWHTFSLTEWEAEKERVRGARLGALRGLSDHLRSLRASLPRPWTFSDTQALLQRFPPLFERARQDPWTEDHTELHLGVEYQQSLWRRSTLAESFSFQADAGDLDVYRFQSNLSLTTPLNERLSLVLRLVSDYASPSAGREKVFNNTLTASGRYAF